MSALATTFLGLIAAVVAFKPLLKLFVLFLAIATIAAVSVRSGWDAYFAVFLVIAALWFMFRPRRHHA